MSPVDNRQLPPEEPPVRCEACQAALSSPGRETIAFLLVDQLTIPVAGCADHLDQFSDVCGITAERRAELVDFLPAGGITCPSCRLARHSGEQPVIPVDDGAVGVLACPEHLSDILGRFQTGVQTRHQITAPLQTSDNPR